MARRINTFRIDYSMIPKKPSFEEVHEFIATVIGLKREEVERIQCSRTHGCAFVKTTDLAIAQRVVEENDNKHEIEVEDKIYKLRIVMEDGAVEVKLHDLPEDIQEPAIVDFLSAYGEVYGLRELMWGEKFAYDGFPSGIWVAKMKVKQNIPSYVVIDGELTALSYYGQKQTCKHCQDYAHNGISCVENKKLLVQKTYADAAKQVPSGKISSTRESKQKKTKKPMQKSVFTKLTDSKKTPPGSSALALTSLVKPTSQLATTSKTDLTNMLPPKTTLVPTKKTVSEGYDTDTSTTSTNSKRSLRSGSGAKKVRPNDEDNDMGDDAL